MADEEKWFTDQERELLWRELEHYLEDDEWAGLLENKHGLIFDAALVKSTWVKLGRFDKQGPIGLQFTQQEQGLLWGLLYLFVTDLECTRNSSEPDHDCDDDCPSFADVVDAIILKLPAPALKHNRVVKLEHHIAAINRTVLKKPSETEDEYMARVKILHAQHLLQEANTMATLNKMLKASVKQEGRS